PDGSPPPCSGPCSRWSVARCSACSPCVTSAGTSPRCWSGTCASSRSRSDGRGGARARWRGRRGAARGRLAAPPDVFFTAWDELPRVLTEPGLGWGERATERRRERERNAELEAPDLVSSDGTEGGIEIPPDRKSV